MAAGSQTTETPPPPERWRRIGRYELGPRLAAGGMAELYVARATGVHGFRKYVALKRILPRFTDDREFVEMFLDEARLAAQLDHPNVVHVHDIGEDDDGPFFTMDYIHGQNLLAIARRLRAREQFMPWDAFVALGAAAAAGLHHAHDRRGFDGRPLDLIHRDVSPTNILVTFEGAVKIVDFGIAKASTSRHSTRPSVRKGKLAYMSPEQCKGEGLDRRSDVFALGVVLYELATLRRAFTGEGEFAIMNRIVNHDLPPPSSLRPDVPAALDRILLAAVARDPQARTSSAQQLQRALERFAVDEGLVATPQALATLMEALFGASPYPWQEAEATDPGQVPDATEDDATAATRAGAVVGVPAAPEPSSEAPTTVRGGPEPSSEAPTSMRAAQAHGSRGGSQRPWMLGGLAIVSLATLAWLAVPREDTAEPEAPASAPDPAPASLPTRSNEPAPSLLPAESVPAREARARPEPTPPAPDEPGSTPPLRSDAAPEPEPASSDPEPSSRPGKSSRRPSKPARRSRPGAAESPSPALPEAFDPDAPAPRVR